MKDPDLIKVDYEKEENVPGYDSKHVPRRKERVDDARTLQLLKNLPAHFAQQVWLTVNVPEGTQSGKYFGTIDVLADGIVAGTVPLEIEVLDFDLLPPVIESGLYASTTWGPRWKAKSPELAFTEMKNLVEHGVTIVGLREYADDMKINRQVHWIKRGDIVLISIWPFKKDRGDIAVRYNHQQIAWLIKKGFIDRDWVAGEEMA